MKTVDINYRKAKVRATGMEVTVYRYEEVDYRGFISRRYAVCGHPWDYNENELEFID